MKVQLFDLDNTLYPGDRGVLARVDQRINEYMRTRVGIDGEIVDATRQRFWAEHGTTLRGLMTHFEVDPDDYLSFVHDLDLSDLLAPDPELGALLRSVPGRKVVFTNASRIHASRVLALLDLCDAFEAVLCLEDLGYVPKPFPEAYGTVLRRLGAAAVQCTLIDDTRQNLVAAKRLGMRTVWVSAGTETDGAIDHVVPSVHGVAAILGEEP